MESIPSTSLNLHKKHIYKLRKKNFQKRLVSQVCFVGYMLIVYQYIKYGSAFLPFILRCFLQSVLAAPYPSDVQLQRIATNNDLSGIPYITGTRRSQSEQPTPSSLQMPGAFASEESTSAQNSEANTQIAVDNLKRKARKLLFHGVLSINIIYLIFDLISPRDLSSEFNGNGLPEKGLGSTPSPFVNGHGLLQGERKGGFSLQMIGETLPKYNLQGNIGLIFSDILILMAQYALFVLACVNFANFDNEDLINDDGDTFESNKYNESNGYDGNVLVARIDPIRAAELVISFNGEYIDNETNTV